MNLSAAQTQDTRRTDGRHPALNHLAQHFHTVQLALTHHHPTQCPTPNLLQQGSVTLLICSCETL